MPLEFVEDPEKEEKTEEESDASRKIHNRRATKAVLPDEFKKKSSVKVFKAAQKWWQKESIKYAFSHPHVTSRLEKLMGSNLVCLTDRDYMQKLQERILEDYAECMDKRIKVRENEEMERVKNLVLSGRIPLDEAPECMADHPIMLIEKYCRRLIAERRAKIKIPKVHIPTHSYPDDTPDPPSGLSIENGHVFRKPHEKLCNPVSRFLPPDEEGDDEEEEEEEEEENADGEQGDEETESIDQKKEEKKVKEPKVEKEKDEKSEKSKDKAENADKPKEEGAVEDEEEEAVEEFMFRRAEYDRLKYESPLIKQLKQCETIEELYVLADEIIGELRYLDEKPGAAPAAGAASIGPSEISSIRGSIRS